MSRLSGAKWWAFSASFAVGCILALGTVTLPTLTSSNAGDIDEHVSTTEAADGIPIAPIPKGEPCADALNVPASSLSDRSQKAQGMPVWIPDEAKAGGHITGGKLCAGSASQPVVVVDDELWIFYEKGYPEEGRAQWLKDLAAHWGGEVTSINGLLAYVNPSEEPDVRSQILLMVPESDQIVRIHAPYGVAPERLVKLASSLPIPGTRT